ncbi:hypothetical protein B9Z55_020803 [Caenorhabditis nigoni]|uniref:1-acylglycerol-3-phosphate O-acyltransferase n=1 Tax=Caenorhabditis nigoni TaxID=1611254 RepID=A0A2G5TP59_9PELO|nr:hypothetical protein B9Z55_020803 [Caenorhabditis nigoni]
MTDFWTILLFVLAVFLIFYNFSTKFHYYVRISFFYITILLHGMEVCVTMIPSWLGSKGADYVFHSFYYWSKWTGIHTTVYNYEITQVDGPAIVICNHQNILNILSLPNPTKSRQRTPKMKVSKKSSLDIVSMSSVWPKHCAVMMKRILAYVPFFNLGAYFSSTIFIDRFNRERAMASVDYCATEMKKRNLKLWVFPEGTRNRDGGFIPFKKGAFNIAVRAQLPIIPVVFSDYRTFYSKPGRYFKNDGEVVIRVLDPIPTEGLTLDDVNELSDKCRDLMLVAYREVTAEAWKRTADRRGEQLVDKKID